MSFVDRFFSFVQTFPAGVAVVLFGGMAWLTEIHLTTVASASAISQMQSDIQTIKSKVQTDRTEIQQLIYEKLSEIDQRLSRIEGALSK